MEIVHHVSDDTLEQFAMQAYRTGSLKRLAAARNRNAADELSVAFVEAGTIHMPPHNVHERAAAVTRDTFPRSIQLRFQVGASERVTPGGIALLPRHPFGCPISEDPDRYYVY